MMIIVLRISHCNTFNTNKVVNKLLYMNMSVAVRLPGAKDQTESGWNVGEITVKILSLHFSNMSRNENTFILEREIHSCPSRKY